MTGHATRQHDLYWPADSVVHRLPAQVKLTAVFGFVIMVALTPRRDVLTVVIDGVLVLAVLALAKLPPRLVLIRLSAVLPLLSFVLFLPLVGRGDQTEVAGISLSIEGLWASWSIVSKALLGATAAIILSATTSLSGLLAGLDRLRLPRVMVSIVSFMFRYLSLLSDQLARMRAAMVARAHDPRWLWQAKPIGASTGMLFVRSYERGERIHHAMVARGFSGTMPPFAHSATSRLDWLFGLLVPLAAAASLLVGTAAR